MPILEDRNSAHGRDLLAALATFVRPIVYECLSSDIRREELQQSRSSGVESVEYQFVNSLKAFIADTVDGFYMTGSISLSDSSDPEDVPSPISTVMTDVSVIEDITRPQVIPLEFRDVFKDRVVESIRDTVSSMPTRLLAFDSRGLQIHLVDHREAIQFLAEIIFDDMDSTTIEFLPDLIAHFQADRIGKFLHLQSSRYDEPDTIGNTVKNFIAQYTGYTILSHTWTKDPAGEITYQGWATREHNPGGYTKIRSFCEASALEHGVRLGWVDTCCINKESSAELDEAIRSMYKWYHQATLCVVHLADTESPDDMPRDSWFTRGWTLQELVAPHKMAVYNMHWFPLFCSRDEVAAAAGIKSDEVISFSHGLQMEIPISRRLQMACGRQVTREEDRAYSLMGILEVSIPIAYGEGAQRAFTRLMRELISTQRDVMDIFNHGYSPEGSTLIPCTVDAYRGRSNAFDHVSWRGVLSKLSAVTPVEPFLLTHIGLRVHLLLVPGLPELYYSDQFDRKFRPKGDLYGRVWNYSLLGKDVDSGNDDKVVVASTVFFGIINFTVTDGDIIIQNPSLSVPLLFSSAKSFKTWYPKTFSSPPVLTLRSSKDPYGQSSEVTVPEGKLKFHGLLRKTLYL